MKILLTSDADADDCCWWATTFASVFSFLLLPQTTVRPFFVCPSVPTGALSAGSETKLPPIALKEAAKYSACLPFSGSLSLSFYLAPYDWLGMRPTRTMKAAAGGGGTDRLSNLPLDLQCIWSAHQRSAWFQAASWCSAAVSINHTLHKMCRWALPRVHFISFQSWQCHCFHYRFPPEGGDTIVDKKSFGDCFCEMQHKQHFVKWAVLLILQKRSKEIDPSCWGNLFGE